MALVTTKLDEVFRRWNTLVLGGHLVLVAIGISLLVSPVSANAQNILVPTFTDTTGKVKYGQKVHTELVSAFKRTGAVITDTKKYLASAKKNRIPPAKAFLGLSIKKLAKGMNIQGVVTGKTAVEKRKFKLSLVVTNQKGAVAFQKVMISQKPEMTSESADAIVAQILTKLGLSEPVAPKDTEPGTLEVETPSKSPDDSTLPAWARTGPATAAPGTQPPPPLPPPPPPPPQEVEAAPAKPAAIREKGSVSNVLLAVGAGLNLRAGLSTNRHESSAFPGIRIDGRFMADTVTDIFILRDFGIAGSFNMGLGLQYRAENDTDKWDAKQYQWHLELIYRFALNSIPLQPALMLRFGYGMTICSIDAPSGSPARSASYQFPFAGIDIYLTLWKPYLRLFLSPTVMFALSSGDQVKGSGMGFGLLAGFEAQLFRFLEIGVGYDLSQFLINLDGGGKTSDTYQGFFVRAGFMY